MIARRHDIVVAASGARFCGRNLPCSIGRGGIVADKREGDGATPAGVFRLLGAHYRPDRMTAPGVIGARPILRRDIWSDDPLDPVYNLFVRNASKYAFSHERLRRADRLYDLVIPTDYNWPDALPGKGSAIFLHAWRNPRHPTEGCIAFAPDDLHWLASRIDPRTRLIVRAK